MSGVTRQQQHRAITREEAWLDVLAEILRALGRGEHIVLSVRDVGLGNRLTGRESHRHQEASERSYPFGHAALPNLRAVLLWALSNDITRVQAQCLAKGERQGYRDHRCLQQQDHDERR